MPKAKRNHEHRCHEMNPGCRDPLLYGLSPEELDRSIHGWIEKFTEEGAETTKFWLKQFVVTGATPEMFMRLLELADDRTRAWLEPLVKEATQSNTAGPPLPCEVKGVTAGDAIPATGVESIDTVLDRLAGSEKD